MKTYSQKAEALGTTIELRLVTDSQAKAEKWLKILWQDIAKFEGRFSRFINDSELIHFNDNSGKKTVISTEFREWLSHLAILSQQSQGFYNPFILPALQRQGYTNSIVTNNRSKDYSDRTVASIDRIEIGSDWAKIPADAALDSGGNGKGYLADLLAKKMGVRFAGFSLSLGGDIAVYGTNEDGKWKIDVESVGNSSNIQYSCSETEYSIATSGLQRSKIGNNLSHIINPKNGKLVDGNVALATVVASNTEIADVLASAILIGGPKLTQNLIDNNSIKAALIQDSTGQTRQFGTGFMITNQVNNDRKAVYA